jgi:hypothetical protein
MPAKIPPLVETIPNPGGGGNRIAFNLHAGQQAAHNSKKLIVAIISGTRAGKTAYGPLFLYREMLRQGPGDYLVVAPSYPLIEKAALPEINYVFGQKLKLGKPSGASSPEFRIDRAGEIRLWGNAECERPSRIIYGHADNPEALEAMTAKAVWCDEAGQKMFKVGSWEAIMRRRAMHEGRVLLSTTPYCHDEITEIYTRQGWKRFGDLTKDDEVLACAKDQKAHFEKPSEIIWQQYSGPMIQMNGGRIDLCVTPNHRILYKNGAYRYETTAEKFVKKSLRSLTIPKTVRLDGAVDRGRRIESSKPIYHVAERRRQSGIVKTHSTIQYDGMIGCVSTSTGFVLTRRNGEECISGNSWNWLKTKIYDPWRREKVNGGDHPDIDVFQFDSLMNPAFPRAEYERAKRDLPDWKFRMMYCGEFTKPAGQIYDVFDNQGEGQLPRHTLSRARQPLITPLWKSYLGMDFGNVNTAGVIIREDPATKRLYIVEEYRPARGKSVPEHINLLNLMNEKREFHTAVGGSWSEQEWRDNYIKGGVIWDKENPRGLRVPGIRIRQPHQRDVEVGIEAVYAALKNNELFVFDNCTQLIEEFRTYSRKLDDGGEPLQAIEEKETFHLLDATRYIVSFLKRGLKELNIW